MVIGSSSEQPVMLPSEISRLPAATRATGYIAAAKPVASARTALRHGRDRI
jgi:hypothetical protein